MRYLLICTHLGTILTFRCMFYIFSCCYNSRTIRYIKFKFEALLSYTKTTKYVKFQCVWCTGARVGIFRISPIETTIKLVQENGKLKRITNSITVIILNIGTDRSEQTVQTQIRLLLMEQSDQGLPCLLFCWHLLNTILHCKIQLFQL